MKLKQALVAPGLVLCCWLFVTVVQAGDFPGRAEFPDVPVMEMNDLRNQFSQVIVVDTRSKYEFEVLRIKDAVNLPVADKNFVGKLKELRLGSNKPIVFYCNGRTCFKSYLAVRKAIRARVDNTYAYDAGMFEWANAYPNQAELLGKSPVDNTKIISKSNFTKRLIEPEVFSDRAYELGSKCIVLDVRDMYQRAAAGFFPGKERWASLDNRKKIQDYIQKAKKENKTVLVYDEVGKQVRWLQYALEDAGINNYYFMKGGAKNFFKQLENAN